MAFLFKRLVGKAERVPVVRQATGEEKTMRVFKRKAKCSSVKRICNVCKVKRIHHNDAQYASGVCFVCALRGLQPAFGSLVARRSSTATPQGLNTQKNLHSRAGGKFRIEAGTNAKAKAASEAMARLSPPLASGSRPPKTVLRKQREVQS